MAKKFKDFSIKQKIVTIVVFIIFIIVVAISESNSQMPQEEASKLKIINNQFKTMTGIFNDVSHIITVKNNTGKDIMRFTLKITYLDKTGNKLDEKEQRFNGFPPSSFGNPKIYGVFKKGSTINVTMGDWNRNAYLPSSRDTGLPGTVYLGDNITKLSKVKTEVINWEEISGDDKNNFGKTTEQVMNQ